MEEDTKSEQGSQTQTRSNLDGIKRREGKNVKKKVMRR